MNLLRRTHEIHFREPRLINSRTPGVAFEMTGSVWWKARRTQHPDIEAVVRDTVAERARAVAIKHDADNLHGAQDAINANLGTIPRTRHYSELRATVILRISDSAKADALQYRHSIAYVERLRWLKEQLYSDPTMLMLDYLDKNPGKTADLPELAHFQQLALKVTNGEKWWCRVLEALKRSSPLRFRMNAEISISSTCCSLHYKIKHQTCSAIIHHQIKQPITATLTY